MTVSAAKRNPIDSNDIVIEVIILICLLKRELLKEQ